jgi:2-methylisocitrate lyase-like PEP mutase family enzyme
LTLEELKEIGVRKYSFGNAMSDAIISTIENFSKSVLWFHKKR